FHPLGALAVGAAAGVIFVFGFTYTQEKLKFDDVLGVWPLHGLCGLWGGIACGIFGLEALGGLGGVSVIGQLLGSIALSVYALVAGLILYSISKALVGIRLTDEQQRRGADLSIHSIRANPEAEI
ncbi:MAG TPA: ammonium transporter, partial [Alphaproteobacteria bacterium]|nr:ammonium transporter [Alphaproteobacteria bacterium]